LTAIGRFFDEQMVKVAFYASKGASRRVKPLLDNSSTAVRPASPSEGAHGSSTAEHAIPCMAGGAATPDAAVAVLACTLAPLLAQAPEDDHTSGAPGG
jgi:hypothetical protein